MNGILNLEVTYDNGKTEKVNAGQREMAEWEQQPFGCSALTALNDKPVSYLRFVAWVALRRADAIPKGKPFAAWAEGVDSVKFADPEEETAPPDPTPRDR